MNDASDDQPVLMSELDEWAVELTDGSTVYVWAHAYCEEDGYGHFSALVRGKPDFEITITRIPLPIVKSIFSWPLEKEYDFEDD